jgi:hypothetical protein
VCCVCFESSVPCRVFRVFAVCVAC